LSLNQQQGIQSEDNEDDAFDKRVKERIRKEEEAYKLKQQQRAANTKESEPDDEDDELTEFEKKEKAEETAEAANISMIALSINEYQMGNFSPILLDIDDLPAETYIMTQSEDTKRIEERRNQVLGTGIVRPDDEDEFERKAREKIARGEEEEDENERSVEAVSNNRETGKSNTQEVHLEHQTYSWSDKYRPRKPRYYNRVHTGYDWNQYNKKHYDIDNPPPKTVQGYKLNVK
jgi:hypothetical protein